MTKSIDNDKLKRFFPDHSIAKKARYDGEVKKMLKNKKLFFPTSKPFKTKEENIGYIKVMLSYGKACENHVRGLPHERIRKKLSYNSI